VLKRTFCVCLTALAVLLFSGCSQKAAGPTLPVILTTPSPVISIIATTAPILTPTPTAGVTENRIGYVRKVKTTLGVNYVTIDYVEFLTGTAAIDAARAHGDAQQDEHGDWYVDDDYYIVNDNPLLRTFPLSATCSIRVVDLSSGSITPVSITFNHLKAMGPTFGSGELLMHISVVNGIVQSLEEQFRP
jgi:hypothetical protein